MNKANHKIIGFVIARIKPDNQALLSSLGIIPKYRRKGLAEKLVRKSIKNLSKNGATFVRLFVESQNNPAAKLYRKIGFQEINRVIMLYKRIN